MARLLRIALVVETGSAYGRSVLRGAKRFADLEANGPRDADEAEDGSSRWVFDVIQPYEATAAVLDPHRVAGAIVRLPVEALVEVVRSGVPVVMLYELPADSPLHRVGMDNEAVGRAAAGQLRQLEPASFAFFGPDTPFAATRRRAFVEALAKVATKIDVEPGWCPAEASEARIAAWLRGLPKPAAVFASNDEAGLRLANCCRAAGCDVPEDVAILGVDNDELLCELCDPPLSSIAVPAERVGYEAAALLERLIAGDAVAPRSVLMPPGQVVTRASTQPARTEDPLVQQSLRYLREHATDRIRIEDVLDVVGCSRRHLEQSMKRAIGRTPGQELTRLRIERAQALLVSTDLKLGAIASRCGYRDGVRLSVAFKREVGLTPNAFRRQRAADAPPLR